MTEAEMNKLKVLTGSTDESLLTVLYEDAEEKILVITGRTRMIQGLAPAVRELTVCNFNRLGSEGMASRTDSEVGISSTFEDIPETLLSQINRYRLARVNGGYYEKNEAGS